MCTVHPGAELSHTTNKKVKYNELRVTFHHPIMW